MNEIKIGKQTFFCESSWQEVDTIKFKSIIKIVFDEDNYANRFKILQILAEIPSKLKRRISDEALYEMTNLLDFIYERDNLPKLDEINIDGLIFLFPETEMLHSSVIEFAIADQLASEIIEGNYSKLDNLFFTLCRPKTPEEINHKFSGDLRERYNSFLIDKRIKELASKVPFYYKIYLFFFFLSVKRTVKERYTELFPKPKEGENIENSEPQVIGWLKLIKSVSETGLYGNFDETSHYNFHTFCLNLCFDIQLKNQQKSKL
jgi:hypothetical protein